MMFVGAPLGVRRSSRVGISDEANGEYEISKEG